jgi:2-polyprenyl-3-methyl-5-hydroxy-6-metoxy-1,4-benzoquinol methylase
VLDAGGELYSPFIKWLYLLGYRDLYVYNIDFERNYTHGSIKYKNRNIITTEFDDGSLDVITCFSVIEHDLPIRELLLEFNRIIHPDGIVIISTDYFPTKVATDGSKMEYGDSTQDWSIFNDEELKNILQIAEEVEFEKPDMRDFHANEKLVSWKNKKYTFAYLELRPW